MAETETEAVNENVFASPWKDSDLVLVVENTEFHVHRAILTLQSPVFKAMLNGQFKEAFQEKITLEGKNPKDMLQFLKLLYPHNMIKRPIISFADRNVAKVLVLADEYQADDVINNCLEEATVTPANVCQILPYADKYNHAVREKCFVVVGNMPTDKVNEELNELHEIDCGLVKNLLIAKCRQLESLGKRARRTVDILLAKHDYSGKRDSDLPDWRFREINCRCGHVVAVNKFTRARKCRHCMILYVKKFVDDAVSGDWTRKGKEDLLSVLKETDDLFGETLNSS